MSNKNNSLKTKVTKGLLFAIAGGVGLTSFTPVASAKQNYFSDEQIEVIEAMKETIDTDKDQYIDEVDEDVVLEEEIEVEELIEEDIDGIEDEIIQEKNKTGVFPNNEKKEYEYKNNIIITFLGEEEKNLELGLNEDGGVTINNNEIPKYEAPEDQEFLKWDIKGIKESSEIDVEYSNVEENIVIDKDYLEDIIKFEIEPIYKMSKEDEYYVTFISDGVKSEPQKTENGKIIKPKDPISKNNLTFRGWFKEDNMDSEDSFNFSTIITRDLTLVAKWEPKVTIYKPKDDESDMYVEHSHEYLKETKLVKDVIPKIDGNDDDFIRWYEFDGLDDNNIPKNISEEAVLSTKPIRENMNLLYSYETANIVNLDTAGGNEIDKLRVKKGDEINLSEYLPVRKNTEFKGWLDEDGKLIYDVFSDKEDNGKYIVSEGEITFTALWGQPLYSLTDPYYRVEELESNHKYAETHKRVVIGIEIKNLSSKIQDPYTFFKVYDRDSNNLDMYSLLNSSVKDSKGKTRYEPIKVGQTVNRELNLLVPKNKNIKVDSLVWDEENKRNIVREEVKTMNIDVK